MQSTLFFIYMGTLLASALAAIIYQRNLARWCLSIMVFYLPLVFIMEVYQALRLYVWKNPTAFVYNIYKPATVIVFAVIYYSLPPMFRFRKLIIGITAVYLIALVITYSFIDSIFANNTFLTFGRGICITFFGIFFLMSFFLLDNETEEKFWQPLMWITIGVLTFYPVISISLGLEGYLRRHNVTIGEFKLYQAIPRLMSIFMYSCFGYAFYLCRKKS